MDKQPEVKRGRIAGRKNYWTAETAPVIEEIMKECVDKKLKTREMVVVFRERGFEGVLEPTVYNWKKKLGFVKKKDVPTYSNQILEDVEGEEFELLKPIKGVSCYPYKISKLGNVKGAKGTKLKWSNNNGYPSVGLSLHVDNWEGTGFVPEQKYTNRNGVQSRVKITKMIAIHRALAEQFIPKPIPEIFEPIWDSLTQEQKDWVQDIYVVDHIDDNKSNPSLDNLRWVSVYENTHHVKRYKQNQK